MFLCFDKNCRSQSFFCTLCLKTEHGSCPTELVIPLKEFDSRVNVETDGNVETLVREQLRTIITERLSSLFQTLE